jgi:hypothetical protein
MVGCMTRRIRALLLVGGLAIAGCGSSSSNGSGATTTEAGGHPAGTQPSASSKMICQKEAQIDIASSLGLKATVSTPTWIDDVYSCKYVYPDGTVTLSVKELLNAQQTTAAYKAFGTKLGKRPEIVSFGEGAFITTNGSVIVRKDFKVLDVDVSKLPQQFGEPTQDRSNIALSIAATVMSCWTGE